MARKGKHTFDDLFAELYKDPEFRRQYRRQKPYYDLLVQIIKRRKELGLKQHELAERAGTHQSSISRIESGQHDCKLSTLIHIAESLNASIDIRLLPILDLEEREYTELRVGPVNENPAREFSTSAASKQEVVI
jgi:transcriptional regulator with XRE-family HTH domain